MAKTAEKSLSTIESCIALKENILTSKYPQPDKDFNDKLFYLQFITATEHTLMMQQRP